MSLGLWLALLGLRVALLAGLAWVALQIALTIIRPETGTTEDVALGVLLVGVYGVSILVRHIGRRPDPASRHRLPRA